MSMPSGCFGHYLDTEPFHGRIPLSGIDDFDRFAMPEIKNKPLRHQEIITYKCGACSRFFNTTHWPNCPHCGARAGVL